MAGPQLNKLLAREWLSFVIGLSVGLLVVLPLVNLGLSIHLGENFWKGYAELVFILFTPKDWPVMLLCWAVVLGPYLIYQLVRSLIWAVKVLRNT